MPDTTTAPTRIAVHPDGVPVALIDTSGDLIEGTLWGAVRAGGAFALVVTEHDHLSGEPTGEPTPGQLRALADALDSDTDPDQWPVEGSRRWEKTRADRLAQSLKQERERAEQLALDVERCQESNREYAEEADRARERAEVAERKLLTLKHGDGAMILARAVVRVEERHRAQVLVNRARRDGHRQATHAARTGLLAGLMAGLLIGRRR